MNKKELIDQYDHSTIITFQGVDNKYLSDDLPYKEKFMKINKEIKKITLQSYSKYFFVNVLSGEVAAGPGGYREEALFIHLLYKNKEKIMNDIFKTIIKQKMEIGEAVQFIKVVENDINHKMHEFEKESKSATVDICREFVEPNVALVHWEDRNYLKAMFSEQFIEKAITYYPEFMEQQFEELQTKYAFVMSKFEQDKEYRKKWSTAIGMNIIYDDYLELQKVSMPSIHQQAVQNFGLTSF